MRRAIFIQLKVRNVNSYVVIALRYGYFQTNTKVYSI